MVLAESVNFKHGLHRSCGIECVEGIMLEPCLLQPSFHVAGCDQLQSPTRCGCPRCPRTVKLETCVYICIYIYIEIYIYIYTYMCLLSYLYMYQSLSSVFGI